MPVKGTRVEGSTINTILTWYEDHPGLHRCSAVAKDLGLTTHMVAVHSRYLMERGDIERVHVDPKKPGGRPVSMYGTTRLPTKKE